MALVVEDGTGIVGANTYVSNVEFRDYATLRQIAVPSDDTEGNATLDAKLILAMDYLETIPTYKGEPEFESQGLSFPRDEFEGIPSKLKQAQIYLTLAALAGVDLMPNVSGKFSDYVVKEKVGPIETTYADPSKFSGETVFTAVEALLQEFIADSFSGISFQVVRG